MDVLDGSDGMVIIGLSSCQVVFISKSNHLEVFHQYLYFSFCTKKKGHLKVFKQYLSVQT